MYQSCVKAFCWEAGDDHGFPNSTCLLPPGHDGSHYFTRDCEILVYVASVN